MDIVTAKYSNEEMINPLLKNKFDIEVDDEVIDLSILNLSKYLQLLSGELNMDHLMPFFDFHEP